MDCIAETLFAASGYTAEGFRRLLQAPQDNPSSEIEGYHLEVDDSVAANLVLYHEILRPVMKRHRITHVICDSGPYALTDKIYNEKWWHDGNEWITYQEPRYFTTPVVIEKDLTFQLHVCVRLCFL